jgi:hypothetical protein
MTIYRLYRENGNTAGFWVQHREWRNTCAQVESIGGLRSGALPGVAPNHGFASVRVRGFDVASGRPMSLGPMLQEPQDRNFRRIADPPWARDIFAKQATTASVELC